MTRLGYSIAMAAVFAAPAAGSGEDVALAPFSPAQPAQLRGGKSPPYKPDNWEDTRYLEITPAMTLRQGNVMVVEGFVYPEPGSPLCNLGGVRVPGMAGRGKLRGGSTALRAILDYGGGTEVHLNRLCPGLHLQTRARQVDLFTPERLDVQAWRVSGRSPSRAPAYVAFSAGGRIRVAKAVGRIGLDGMDEHWLLAWWGGARAFDVPVRPAGGGPRRNIWPIYPASSDLRVRRGAGEWPVLIVLQRRCRALVAGPTGWRLDFADPAGRIIIAPLYGRRWVKAEAVAKWKNAPDAQAVEQARRWSARLRRVPIDVTESQELRDGLATVTETFTYERIDDDWRTPGRLWAAIPPMFALARAKGFGIDRPAGKPIADWNWLGRLGPLAGVEGAGQVTYRIHVKALDDYLRPPGDPAPRRHEPDKSRLLRRQLRDEVAEILRAGRMAPHMWTFGEMSAAYYTSTYFHNPPEMFVTLLWALPHLDTDQAAATRAYLRNRFSDQSPFSLPYWDKASSRKGARRERFGQDAQARHWVGGANFTLQSIYAAWLYADRVAGEADRPAIWAAAKTCLDRHRRRARVEWDYTERIRFPVRGTRLGWHMTHGNHPSVETRYESFNSRINGLVGYVRLARLAGDRRAEQAGVCWLARALALRYAQLHFDQYLIDLGVHEPEALPSNGGAPPPSTTLMRGCYIGPRLAWTYIWKENQPAAARGVGARVFFFHVNHPVWSTSRGSGGVAGGRDVIDTAVFFVGLDLTPASARFYADYCGDFVRSAFRRLERTAPTWHMADGPTYWSSEEVVGPPEVAWACLLTKAMVLKARGEELYGLVDFPQARFGDLYYIQKLAVALRAFAAEGRSADTRPSAAR